MFTAASGLSVLALALAGPGLALAQDPSSVAYAEAGGDVLPAPAAAAAMPASLAKVAQATQARPRPAGRMKPVGPSRHVPDGAVRGSSGPDDRLAVLAATAGSSSGVHSSSGGRSGGGGGGGSSSGGSGSGANTIAPNAVQSAADDGPGSLPFTGWDVGILGFAGAILLALGLALRRSTQAAPRRRDPHAAGGARCHHSPGSAGGG